MTFSRRKLLGGMSAAFAATLLPGAGNAFGVNDARVLNLYNVHNSERITIPYWRNGYYYNPGLKELQWFLRDWRNNQTRKMDARLFDILYLLQEGLDNTGEGLHLLSGYRSPETNEMLRRTSSGVAKTSFHLVGRASDIRVPGVSTKKLRSAALNLRKGGVGYYPKSHFVHVDTGNVRTW